MSDVKMTKNPQEDGGPEFVTVKGAHLGNLMYHFLWLNNETLIMENAEEPDVEQIRRNLNTMSNVVKVLGEHYRL